MCQSCLYGPPEERIAKWICSGEAEAPQPPFSLSRYSHQELKEIIRRAARMIEDESQGKLTLRLTSPMFLPYTVQGLIWAVAVIPLTNAPTFEAGVREVQPGMKVFGIGPYKEVGFLI